MSSVRYVGATGLGARAGAEAGTLRDALDRDGCAFGQVTRERLDNMSARLQSLQATVNAIAIGVMLQLVAFLFAVVVFLLNHVR
jgi:hypothetical protein